MHDEESLPTLRKRLTQQGFPTAYIDRTIEELEDHQASLEEEAHQNRTTIPTEQVTLGTAETLADSFTTTLPQTNWLGRHPVVSFCFLPIVLFPAAFFFLGFTFLKLLGGENIPSPSVITETWIPTMANSFHYGSIAIFSTVFCWLAIHSFRGWRWALISSLVMAFHGLIHFVEVKAPNGTIPGSVLWAYGLNFNILEWDLAAIISPLAILGVFYFFHKRNCLTHTNSTKKAQA